MNKLKHFIFKCAVLSWKLFPFKIWLAGKIKARPLLFKKVYKDFRYNGVIDVPLGTDAIKLYNPGFTTIENEIFWNGIENGWEKTSLGLWNKLAMDAKVILDIGANTGIYSILASQLNPKAEIIAFEPVKRTTEIFKKNLELNPALNIHLIEKAVSNKNDHATFYDLPTESQYSASLNENMLAHFSERISYEVETIQLDSLDLLRNKKIDLIKLDVEMHEPEAIEGMMNIIRENEPTLLIEVLTSEIAEKIESLLKEIDYCYFSIDEGKTPVHIPRIRRSDYYNILLIKKEKLHIVNLSCS